MEMENRHEITPLIVCLRLWPRSAQPPPLPPPTTKFPQKLKSCSCHVLAAEDVGVSRGTARGIRAAAVSKTRVVIVVKQEYKWCMPVMEKDLRVFEQLTVWSLFRFIASFLLHLHQLH